jgi:WhiB family redox-sensing transcriptional regulator
MTDINWRTLAACFGHDPALWFPDDILDDVATQRMAQREAKRICGTCPVTAECTAHALRNDERFGIWGGLTETDRMRTKLGWA